jgi:hypothetical protein
VNVLALTDPHPSLAHAVDALVVLARNECGGACVWCGSHDIELRAEGEGDGLTLEITCQRCGSQLTSERPVRLERTA